jgi:hypothetical protein
MRLLLAILLLLIAAPAQAQQGQGMSKAMVVSSCGGGALPSGALNQLTMDTTGRLCQSGIGSNVCAQATAYLARTTGGNEGGNAVNMTALICGLVTDGVIDGTLTGVAGCGTYLDALYILAQQNVADAKLNLCGTGYTLPTNTATFTAYQGYSAFPVPAIDTGFDPSLSTTKYSTNSGSISAWAYNLPDDTKAQLRTTANSVITYLFATLGGSFYCAINNTNDTFIAHANSIGLWGCERSSSTNMAFYLNGANIGTGTNTAASNYASHIFLGGGADAYNTTKTISEAHIGGLLGPTRQLAFYNRLRTYMTAVGVP